MDFFATASSGTEDLLADELRRLGAADVRPGGGGVGFSGGLETALQACLWSRTAMRVLRPLGEFPAPDADALYEGAKGIDWDEHVGLRCTFAVEATGTASTLESPHFTALRVKDAIADRLREKHGARPDVDAKDPDVRVVAHLSRGRCGLSLDLAGEPLFKRGWRTATTEAPLRETLAAAVLLAGGYDGMRPLVDPMCGSGTLAVEAAMIAQNVAPGLWRKLGVERWPSFTDEQRALLRDLRDRARRGVRRGAPAVLARDRDEKALAAARANVKRAGVPVKVEKADARELAPLDPPGFVVVNPPYGHRLEGGGKKALKTFFWQLGQRWRALSRHRIVVLAGGPEFESAFGLPPTARRPLWNGPLRCTLLVYEVE